MDPWLSRLRHDLVKRAVWAARDRREATREPSAADALELRAGLFELRDGEGRIVSARELWEELRRQAPPVPPAALDSFGAAVALGLYWRRGVIGLWWGLCAGLTAVALALLLRFLHLSSREILPLEAHPPHP